MHTITLTGRLIGRRRTTKGGTVCGEIVHVVEDNRPAGPAQNAYVYVDVLAPGGGRRARYISWINLFDIEHANSVESGRWRTVEPAHPYQRDAVAWEPFGWESVELPNVADLHSSLHFSQPPQP